MNDLQTIALLNAKVKQIVSISDSIFIVALNAMFQARRAKAMGFNTVTNELRKFSSEIAHSMQSMRRSIEFQVEFIARHQHKKHISRLINRMNVESANKQLHSYAERIQNNLNRSTDDIYKQFIECYREFSLAYYSSLHSAKTGHSLFIHAKVEAQSTGEYVETLLPVVEQIEVSVTKLSQLLSDIKNIASQVTFIRNQEV